MKRLIYPPIDCTVADFAQWLINYTQFIDPPGKFHPRSPAEGKGHYILQPIPPPDEDIGERPLILEMNCVYVPEGDEPPSDDVSEFRGIKFTIVPFPSAQTSPRQIELVVECTHDPVKGYFSRFPRAIESRWSVSPERRDWTSTATPIEGAPAETEGEAASQRGPASGAGPDDSARIADRITVPFERWDAYSHLRALCHSDPRFNVLGNVKTDVELEHLEIWDRQTMRRGNGTAGPPTLGIVQVLPAGTNTVIVFVAKDRFRGKQVTDKGKALFREFIRLVKSYFHDRPTVADDALDPLDRKIIEVVRQIEHKGLRATDELVAMRVPLNPQTDKPYHRLTINRRRIKMRDRGYEV